MSGHPPPPALSGRQRAWLRGQAHPLAPAVRAGQAGVSDGLIAEVDRALLHRELIKVRLEKPEDKKADAALLAARTASVLCGMVGHTVILWRPNPEKEKRGEPTIRPPADDGAA